MKGKSFRGFLSAMTGFIAGMRPMKKRGPKTTNYPDPVLTNRYTKTRKGSRRPGKIGSPRLGRPDCSTGTYTHQDWLVRHLNYNRRLADGYLFAYISGYTVKMPMPAQE